MGGIPANSMRDPVRPCQAHADRQGGMIPQNLWKTVWRKSAEPAG